MAVNTVLYKPGTVIKFDKTGVGDVLWTPSVSGALLAAGAGRRSAALDLGSGNRPALYRWTAYAKWATTLDVNVAALLLFLLTSDTTGTAADWDGGIVDGDAAEATLANFPIANYIGQVMPGVATDITYHASGIVEIRSRYVVLGGWNASATKACVADTVKFTLQSVPDDIEAAA